MGRQSPSSHSNTPARGVGGREGEGKGSRKEREGRKGRELGLWDHEYFCGRLFTCLSCVTKDKKQSIMSFFFSFFLSSSFFLSFFIFSFSLYSLPSLILSFHYCFHSFPLSHIKQEIPILTSKTIKVTRTPSRSTRDHKT